jgi:hypothetical protein
MNWPFSIFETSVLLILAAGFWSIRHFLVLICTHLKNLDQRHEMHLEAQGFTWHRLREASQKARDFEQETHF